MDALLDALAVLLPVRCVGCDRPDRSLCHDCRVTLEPDVSVRMVGGMRVFAALEYSGSVRRIILAFKQSNRTDTLAALARPPRVTRRSTGRPSSCSRSRRPPTAASTTAASGPPPPSCSAP